MFLLRFSKKGYAIIGGTILLCCVVIFHSLSTIVSSKLLDGVNKGELIFEVEKGDTLSDIIDDLQNNELIVLKIIDNIAQSVPLLYFKHQFSFVNSI